jgi:hypothetical protein
MDTANSKMLRIIIVVLLVAMVNAFCVASAGKPLFLTVAPLSFVGQQTANFKYQSKFSANEHRRNTFGLHRLPLMLMKGGHKTESKLYCVPCSAPATVEDGQDNKESNSLCPCGLTCQCTTCLCPPTCTCPCSKQRAHRIATKS